MPTAKKLIATFFYDHPNDFYKVSEISKKLDINIYTARRVITELHNDHIIEYYYKRLWRLKQ